MTGTKELPMTELVQNETRARLPRTSTSETNIFAIHEVIEGDHRLIIWEIAGSAQSIISDAWVTEKCRQGGLFASSWKIRKQTVLPCATSGVKHSCLVWDFALPRCPSRTTLEWFGGGFVSLVPGEGHVLGMPRV